MHESYKKWLEDGKPKVYCGCGCDGEIVITINNKYNGIPKYISGHNCCGHPRSDITKKKISEGNKGKKRSKEVRQKMSESHFGNIPWNKGLKGVQLYSIPWNKGIPCSEETKIKLSEANRGQIPWIKGRHHTKETKQKIRDGNIGKTISKEQKIKISNSISKENHWNWKGGISKLPYCKKWTEELRESVRERDNRNCQECGKTEEENDRKLTVHHIHYKKEDCDPDLITLCNVCSSKVNFNRDYWEEYFTNILKKRNLLKK